MMPFQVVRRDLLTTEGDETELIGIDFEIKANAMVLRGWSSSRSEGIPR